METKGNAIFPSWPRSKVELKRENGRNTTNTGSKGYVWLLNRRIHGIASETRMLSVEAVSVMPSVTGCHILSTPIRKAKPNNSDGGTTRSTFATSFNGPNFEEKTINSTKSFLKAFHDQSTPWQKQKSRRLGFEKKNLRFGIDKNLWTISTNLDIREPGAYTSRLTLLYDSFFAEQNINTVTPQLYRRQLLSKKATI